ncbi:RNA polymerase sigma factor [Microbacterium pumilum]|uniref:RNA polymerase sigma factor n=1 Tax=Microbacterium pumilum TaxID=344165 RepID=A0ABP5E9U4_9MICO
MPATEAAVEAVWRIESGRLVGALARVVGDFSTAEDLAQDALEAALRQWPRDGIPPNPGAWLMTSARHMAVDRHRHDAVLRRKLPLLAAEARLDEGMEDPMTSVDDALDTSVHDDLLRLIFTACHPVLTMDSRVALTLRTLGGLQTREIARAFLVSESAMGQRISRAKKTLTQQRIPFQVPSVAELPHRLSAVLAVIYLIFTEGFSATSGDDWTRPELCQEALRLGRLLTSLQPDQAEVHGLVALMELQSARLTARTARDGSPVLLADQERGRWDRLLIRRGLAALDRAEELGVGPYTLQAAIAACHVRAASVDDTDWTRIAALYTVLAYLAPSPIVTLNHAIAIGMAEGPDRGLALLDDVAREPLLADYPQLPAARATFLRRLGRTTEASSEFERAAALTANADTRTLFLRQAEDARQGT